jgi:signal transduction histidine kinase/CheY-like chemotaxis protein
MIPTMRAMPAAISPAIMRALPAAVSRAGARAFASLALSRVWRRAWFRAATRTGFAGCLTALFAMPFATVSAQDFLTLEQVSSRTNRDAAAIFEGRTVAVRGQVAGGPVWALDTYYLPLRDSSYHGLLLRGDLDQFSGVSPGDWVEVSGTIQSRAGFPMLAPSVLPGSNRRPIQVVRQGSPPPPVEVSIADLNTFRYLGLMIHTSAAVDRVSDNLGGETLELADRGVTIAVFLPRAHSAAAGPGELRGIRPGQHVRVTGLATQYSLEAPHYDGFQVMLAHPEDVEVIPAAWAVPPLAIIGAIAGLALIAGLWWYRERRLGTHRRSLRAFHTLSEEIISASSPSEVAEKLVSVLPTVTQATAVRLYLYHRRTKSLERVATGADPEPMAVPLDSPPEGLVSGAVMCFKNRTLLNVPDVRRSPLLRIATKKNVPRSAMFLPLLAQNEVLGVLEVGNARRIGYFSVEEQAAAQHLANQVAASLKLQDRQSVREQLFRSEKLAATGQLISGVASELRAPIESILQLSISLAAYGGRAVPERDLQMLAGESQRASEIVSRLVSFARPDDSAARPVDVNALVTGLMEFRDPEWKTLELRVQNRLATDPALVIGVQGQMEQVFLNLLIHAEQCAAEAPGKAISAASTVIGGRVLVEIGYATASAKGTLPGDSRGPQERPDGEPAPGVFSSDVSSPDQFSRDLFSRDPFSTDPFSADELSNAPLSTRASVQTGVAETEAVGLAVCQGIIQSHGGEIRFRTRSGSARFEIDLPLAPAPGEDADSRDGARTSSVLTLLLVDSDAAGQRQLTKALSGGGHRVVPTTVEEAADLCQRLRFDAVFWALRPGGPTSARHGMDFQERVRAHVPVFVLVSNAYDPDLARSIESGGGFLIARPIQESQLNGVLRKIEALSHSRQ